MFAIALTVFFVLIGLASIAVLVDSGLRWQSAYGRLKNGTMAAGPMFEVGMRPVSQGGYAGFGRAPTIRPAARFASRAAA